ncbi:glycosyltransferase family 9 protein [Synechococcus sp. UW179B]|uniref:glycosyltransferase family 9 protein n=1 Tax=Synechococcus sp. UW179B TaxID=2575516 RepID=UPI000E0E3D60|nr:lipopolysaccharide heptosyltransferase family protein [Synechococcus sp. UW179B]
MRVLVLSPGTAQQQLERMPAIAACANALGASIQVACSPAHRSLWTLLPSVEKIIPFDFSAAQTMADWANLLGCVREPDFQVCLNFADGRQVNLMLSMSHIPTRVAEAGFASTATASQAEGWSAQRLSGYLAPLGLSLDAAAFRISLPAALMSQARERQPQGDGPLLMLQPTAMAGDWPSERWKQLPLTIKAKLPGLRTIHLGDESSLSERAAQIACADVVLTSCPVTSLLATFCGVPLVALGLADDQLPERDVIRHLGNDDLRSLSEADVLEAMGFG